MALVVVYIGLGILQRYNIQLADHFQDLVNLRQKQTGSSQQQKQVLEKLRPKLELIGLRLAKIEGVKNPTNSSTADKNVNTRYSGLEFHGEDIKFDAIRLFDVLDADGSGGVTFDELNVILELRDVELQEFIRRMNEMADSSSNNASVTRPVFVKYFLQVLTDTCNLSISYEEAEVIFDEMANRDKNLDEIDMNKFYTSSMSDFLSDSQILELIKVSWKKKPGSGTGNGASIEMYSLKILYYTIINT